MQVETAPSSRDRVAHGGPPKSERRATLPLFATLNSILAYKDPSLSESASLWQNRTATELSTAFFWRRLSGEGLVAPERKTTRFSAECEVAGRQYSQQ